MAQLVKANLPPEEGTGWHRHEADFRIMIMVKGWAKLMCEDQVTLVEAGDCVHQRPGIRHCLFDYSPDMECLEIVSPADFKSFRCATHPSSRASLTCGHSKDGAHTRHFGSGGSAFCAAA